VSGLRLRILSDLHLEAADFAVPAADADLTILAGDIANGGDGIAWGQVAFDGPVLYVPGNHEFYDRDYDDARAEMQAAARGSAVTLMEREERILGGVRFLGCTLWTDFALEGEAGFERAMRHRKWLIDFTAIRWGDRTLAPEDTIGFNRQDAAWLAARLDTRFDGPTVVITHHAPQRGSIAPAFATHPLNPAFVTDLDALMGRAVLWIHGHTHTAFDYDVRGTRVVCNPRGYPHENTGFDPALIVTV
jgi:predicted phosphodiesterase